jgi:DNA polymerase-1
VVIVSSDKDMLQLVDEHTFMVNPVKDDEWYDASKVEALLGVKPWQVPDFLALKGDAIDNIPGAPGIGDKGARELIARFGTVENALEHAGEVERKTYRESLLNHRDQILLSKRLATIDTTAPVPFELGALRAQEPDPVALRQLYRELEFYSLLRELEPEQRVERDYRRLETAAEVDAYLAAIPKDSPVAVAIQAGGNGELALGMAGLAWRPGEARSLSLGLLDRLRPLLEEESRPKMAHDWKTVLLTLSECGVEPRGFRDDVMLYAFLLDADPSGCTLEALAERRLDRKLTGAIEERAECVFELARLLGPEVDARGLRALYEEIDLPLVPVLARMERTGIRIDPVALEALSRRLDAEIQRLSAEIQQMAGRPFNINSPQQLGKVLFEELKLRAPVRYGRGKTISTAADVLEELAAEHPIAAKVLEYRQLAKLKGTYVDALPQLINPRTGRLHTSFNQTGAATGRLSSSNPNLQNIPIRTELGREIRAAFVPREGWSLLVADYSQIELRLLAHMSRDPVLLEAFRKGEDIHTRTAAEVFGVPPLMVTPELRRNAKAVNFGIIYGLSAFGLSAQLGISREEAETYIRNYFARYAGVKRFIDETIAEVRRTGETRTLFGRRRPIPDINSSNPNARGFAERTAINTPLQGTAADLIKLAMIRIDRELQARRWRTAMLLQVHDELLFESPPEEVQEAAVMVRREMENVYRLEVPLVVETGIGPNWRDAK